MSLNELQQELNNANNDSTVYFNECDIISGEKIIL